MISITLDRRSERKVNAMLAAADQRVVRGEELFLREIAGVLRREVQAATPAVPEPRGRKYKYADRLQMTGVEGMPHAEAAVAVWLKRSSIELKAEDLMRTALLVRPTSQAAEYVRVLAGAGLWPADLLPFRLKAAQATVVARRVRADEAQALRDRLWKGRRGLVRALTKAGAPPFEFGKGTGAGQRVYVDIAWEVLRNEFGWGESPAHAVWRGALQKMMAHVPVALRKMGEYLLDGNEARFDSADDGSIAWRKVESGMEFQRVLMPFVKRRVNAR